MAACVMFSLPRFSVDRCWLLAWAVAVLVLSACDSDSLTLEKEQQANSASAQLVNASGTSSHTSERYNYGRAATKEEIAGWDIDVRPDGLGLPPGQGSVEDGETLYEEKCASCHGVFGEGEGRWPKLSGGVGTLTHERPDKTVGSYWPYASTLWDYIHRAMPFIAPQSLSDDETYAITAYVLNLNDLVDDDFVLNNENLAVIEMPNRDGFMVDDRPDVSNPRCMKACKEPASINIVESLRGITPTKHLREDGTDAKTYGGEQAEELGSFEHRGAKLESEGQVVYDSACKVCHGAGVAGAPVTGNTDVWRVRGEQGIDMLYRHAVEGFQGKTGVMPARGGQAHLSDDEVKNAVDYMLKQSEL